MHDATIQKNIFDLEYSKYLQFYTTGIIILFTYIMGIGVAFLTGQLDLANPTSIISAFSVSLVFLLVLLFHLLKYRRQLKAIQEKIALLDSH